MSTAPVKLRVSAAWLAALLTGCATPDVVRRIEASHPGAQYEATALGCGSSGPTARRFGRDLRLAVLWSRQVVREARRLPCEVVVEAVTHGAHRPVYRIRWSRDASRTEGAVSPP